MPDVLSKHFRMAHGRNESDWGRLKTDVRYLESQWTTSLWYDTKSAAYLLPLAAKLRKKYKLQVGMLVKIELMIHSDFFP